MKRIFSLLVVIFVLFSCVKEPIEKGGTGGGTQRGLNGIEARLIVPGYSQVNSRATDDNALIDVWVLQYIDGMLVSKTHLPANTNWFNGFTLPVEPMPVGAGNVVYFFANTTQDGDPIATDPAFVVGSSTIGDLEEFQFPIAEESFDPYLPMRGEYREEIKTGLTNTIAVTLERMAVKINFTFDATALNQFIATSIQLCQAPNFTALPRNAFQPPLPVGGATGQNPPGFSPYPIGSVFTDYAVRPIEPNSTEMGTSTWYMAENVRGSFPVLSNSQKYPASPQIDDEENEEMYTFILLTGTCVDNANRLVEVSYRIYLGGNATGDMNLIANTTYNVTTTLKGTNEADTRITVEEIAVTDALDPANSYILNPNGALQIFNIPVSHAADGIAAVQATPNYTSGSISFDPLSAWSAAILWQTWQATATTQLSVSRVTATDGNYIRVVLPAGVQPGNNAVIALKDAGGTTLWSWHLWITDYNPYTSNPALMNGQLHTYGGPAFLAPTGALYGKQIMDRDLGAMWTGGTPFPSADAAKAATAYGLFYQWGRKDPFTQSNGDEFTPVTIYGGAIDSPPLVEGTGTGPGINRVSITAGTINNLVNAVKNPTTIYYNSVENPGDWYTTIATTGSTSAQNNTLWGHNAAKSVFDPCPPGYRVPDSSPASLLINPWVGFGGNVATIAAGTNPTFAWYEDGISTGTTGEQADNPTAGRRYTGNGAANNAWYPTAGLRFFDTGALARKGWFSGAWSASNSTSGALYKGLYMSSLYNIVTPSATSNRAYGFEVRCVQE